MTDVCQWAVVSPAAFFFEEFALAIQWILCKQFNVVGASHIQSEESTLPVKPFHEDHIACTAIHHWFWEFCLSGDCAWTTISTTHDWIDLWLI